jgi:hypothetical protein
MLYANLRGTIFRIACGMMQEPKDEIEGEFINSLKLEVEGSVKAVDVIRGA